MSHDKEPQQPATAFISIRVDTDQKRLVEDAAEREGLQISSFFIMLLVRAHILPSSCMKKIKRRPVPLFNELHRLIGTINKIGGNCKQLADALPHTTGLRSTHFCINRAAEAIVDAIQGKTVPANVNLAKYERELTDIGYAFNAIVRSVNAGKPQLSGLRIVLENITGIADAITTALTEEPIQQAEMGYVEDLAEHAMEEMRTNMKKAAKRNTNRQKGDA